MHRTPCDECGIDDECAMYHECGIDDECAIHRYGYRLGTWTLGPLYRYADR